MEPSPGSLRMAGGVRKYTKLDEGEDEGSKHECNTMIKGYTLQHLQSWVNEGTFANEICEYMV